MDFRKHSELKDKHAFLGASKYHWINYDVKKLSDSYLKHLATLKGTELHEFAAKCIDLRINLPRTKNTLNMYVNDGIKYNMKAEQPLYYSDNCFGTADSISFRDDLLRIHDLKTGVSPTSMHQLEIYAALFCLEYHVDPEDIDIELRIYQKDDKAVYRPETEDIISIIDKIILFDRTIDELNLEV